MSMHWNNLAETGQNFVQSIDDLKEKLPYKENDVRYKLMNQLKALTYTSAFLPLRFGVIIEKNEIALTNALLKVIGITEDWTTEDTNLQFYNINLHCRTAYITLFMFSLENTFNTILGEIPNIGSQDNWYYAHLRLINYSGIPNKDYKNDVFKVPTLIRNSLHSNGIHIKNDTRIFKVKDRNFGFKKGIRISFADWETIFFIFYECLLIIEEIFFSEKIRNIEFIKALDDF